MTTNHTGGLDAAGVAERDIFEVANQLLGYVDTGTPEPLASFLLREGAEASKLADEIIRLRSALVDAPAGELSEDVANFVRERVTNIQRNFTPRSTNRIEAEALLERMEAALASPTPSVAALQAEIERLTRERQLLAEAIADAAKRAGIYNGEAPLTGPHLLMLADDLASAALLPPDTEGEAQPVADESLVERAFDIGRMWNHALTGHVCDARDVARTLQSDLFEGLSIEPWPIDQTSSRDDAIVEAVKAIKAAFRRASTAALASVPERGESAAEKAVRAAQFVEKAERAASSPSSPEEGR